MQKGGLGARGFWAHSTFIVHSDQSHFGLTASQMESTYTEEEEEEAFDCVVEAEEEEEEEEEDGDEDDGLDV